MKKALASAAERFNYSYSEEELKGFVEPVEALSQKAGKVRRRQGCAKCAAVMALRPRRKGGGVNYLLNAYRL